MVKWDNVATAVVTAMVMTVGAGAIAKFTDGSVVGMLGGVSKSELAREADLSADATLADIIAALKTEPVATTGAFVPSVGNHEETKAIVAYYSAKGEKTCPDGWSPYTEAKDRFIVGAGEQYKTVGGVGGEASVKLTAAELPSHSHTTTLTKVQGIGGTHGAAVASGGNEKLRYTSSAAGGGKAHNNMPPFIALTFCKQD